MAIEAVLIAGPTASGKSALALDIAEAVGGTIINADSMQVYRDLVLLSACPMPHETARAPHHLYGYLDGNIVCSAAIWASDAVEEINRARLVRRLPILVGGTGLYFKTLLEGIAHIPDIPLGVRTAVRDRLARFGPNAMHRELADADPDAAARLAPGDSQRIARAMEVFEATGTPITTFQKGTLPGPLKQSFDAGCILPLVVDWPREELYARCDLRFNQMLENGAIEEVKALVERQLPPDRPVMKALGVPELAAYLEGVMDLEDAREQAQMQTRRFAKRQMTWFRNQTSSWQRVNAQEMASESAKIIKKLQGEC